LQVVGARDELIEPPQVATRSNGVDDFRGQLFSRVHAEII